MAHTQKQTHTHRGHKRIQQHTAYTIVALLWSISVKYMPTATEEEEEDGKKKLEIYEAYRSGRLDCLAPIYLQTLDNVSLCGKCV